MGGVIQRPAGARAELAWRWPEGAVATGSRLVVAGGEQAVLRGLGRTLCVLGPGVHTLAPASLPALRALGPAPVLALELLFVSAMEVGGLVASDRSDPVRDPVLGETARLQFEASCAVRVLDAAPFAGDLAGADPAGAAAGALAAALARTLAAAATVYVAQARVSLLELDAAEHGQRIAERVLPAARQALAPQGLELVRIDRLRVGVAPEDELRLASQPIDALASTERAAVAVAAPPFEPGDVVEVPWSDGATYRGTVTRLEVDRVEVRWDGTSRTDWIPLGYVSAPAAR